MGGPSDSLIQIRIVEDNIRALSAKLKCDILQIALRSSLHDLPPDQGATSKRDLVN